MTTFWLSFNDPEATAEKRFLGVAIFDMDESAGELSVNEIAKHAWDLGLNPGGAVLVQEISGAIPDKYKNKLITDDALLLSLGSRGRANQQVSDVPMSYNDGGWADTTSPHGRLIVTVLGGLAEFERALIVARTTEGRNRALARGVRFGRPSKLNPHQRREALARVQAGEAQSDVARTYAVDPAVICRLVAASAI
jgi:hypothetical protein